MRPTGLLLPMFSCHVGHLEHKGCSFLSFHWMHEASLRLMSGLLFTACRARIRCAKIDGRQSVLAQWLDCVRGTVWLNENVQCGHHVLLECHINSGLQLHGTKDTPRAPPDRAGLMIQS